MRQIVIKFLVHRKLKQEYSKGNISRAELRRLKKVCKAEVCEAAVNVATPVGSERPVLSAIWKFIEENWEEILGIILRLAPLLLALDLDEE